MRSIFVFGSNLKGIHGKGAAYTAKMRYGAIQGVGHGIQGDSYAIPTKNAPYSTLNLQTIDKYVQIFKEFAKEHPEMVFNVTRIGCGLAGYQDESIAPMFKGAPENCLLPPGWRAINGEKSLRTPFVKAV